MRIEQLGTFAGDLGIAQAEYQRITAPNTYTQVERIGKVCFLYTYLAKVKLTQLYNNSSLSSLLSSSVSVGRAPDDSIYNL